MLQEEFLKDYFKNSFMWWGLFLFFLTKINAYPPAYLILHTIVDRALYVPVVFICLAITLFFAVYPIRKSLKQLLLEKKSKKFLLFYFLICLVLLVHVIYFLVGPYLIFSKLDSEFVIEKFEFEKDMDITTLSETIAIPLLFAFTMTVVKYGLQQEQYEIDDRLVKNLKFGGYVAIICALLYFLDVFITSFK